MGAYRRRVFNQRIHNPRITEEYIMHENKIDNTGKVYNRKPRYPKNNGYKLDFWLLILAITIALTLCLISAVM